MLYLNGHFVRPEDAKISALDRGCLFGDGVYEVIPVYSRQPFRPAEHIRRLEASLAAIGLPNPHTAEQWIALVKQVISQQDYEDLSIYLHVTRGNAGERDFPFPENTPPTVLINPAPLVVPSQEAKATGVRAISHADFRWLRCDIKSLNLLPAVLLRQAAKQAGCAECVMFRDGMLSEGAASNIFVVKNGVIAVPPKDHLILPGITYDVVIELAQQHGLPLEVRHISETEVRNADELWMTSSTKEVLGIIELDGKPVGNGRVGPLAQRLDSYYQAFKQTIMRKPITC
ncbi:D-amino acid aminotransferase [Chitinimonas sp. BJB300]|uniref:D-amino acid aminotransferase n=1 Tax=Chitinimonas sp. BJB300 TaxID=1559339 RepID=UPI000C0E8E88|nr:D-amino acid aminotransferase [Chitinimonas sp. BJB300]PHV12304.1 D-amino acid aminotransferase [Chitinimonas sp. BJB300]TSJ88165.1 D-amino acid aminotransferase [Chitinimonas sp. BJB300]